MPRSASSATPRTTTATAAVTPTSRPGENGSSSLPAVMAVTAMPAIIISQRIVAAGARRCGATRAAISASRAVPPVPTPMPTAR